MKRLMHYLDNLAQIPKQIILHKYSHGVYFQGKVDNIPPKYRNWFVGEHSNLTDKNKIQFTIIEEI